MHYRIASATALALILSGCSTPQHTNLLIFGTNTVVGLKVGADATQTPAIQLAYSRQELVLMPLLANTRASRENGDLLMSPCPATEAPAIPAPGCKFVGEAGPANKDSYSVLASFGAKGNASKVGGEAKAGGAIAQYFATGLAARELAKHGSALVAASESATAAADSEARYGIIVEKIKAGRAAFAAQVAALGGNFLAKLDAVDVQLRLGSEGFSKACRNAATAADCSAIIRNPDNFDTILPRYWDQASEALNAGG